MTDIQAGWYPDPSGNVSKLRYWDGTQWTEHYSDTQPLAEAQVITPAAVYAPIEKPVNKSDETLKLIGFVFSLVSTVCCAIFIIPLAWMIPMTVHSWGIYKGTKRNTTAFGICMLLFVSLVSGILLLIADQDN